MEVLVGRKRVSATLTAEGLHFAESIAFLPFGEIFAIKRIPHSLVVYGIRRKKHKWRPQEYVVSADDGTLAALQKDLEARLGLETQRPKKLRVFINPFGGKRRAAKNMEKITLEEEVTTRGEQAGSWIAETPSLDDYAGVVVVGGDGLFHEVVNGMLRREDRRRLPIGIIPSGSTDTVAYSAAGTNDIVTHALHIIVGDRHALDVCKLTFANGSVRFATNFVGFGYFSDTLWESDKHRWMGPARYDYSGFLTLLRWRRHRVRVRYVEKSTATGGICHHGDAVCHPPVGGTIAAQLLEQPEPLESEWKTLEGMTRSTNLAVMALRSDKTVDGLCPDKHLADGTLHLIHVPKCSRIQFLRFLIHVARPGWNQYNLPFVKKIPCSRVELQLSEDDSRLNVDGEAVASPSVTAEVLPAALVLFARGVERQGVPAASTPLVAPRAPPQTYGTSDDEAGDCAPLLPKG